MYINMIELIYIVKLYVYIHRKDQALTGDDNALFSDAPVHSDNLSVRMENPAPTF